MVMRHHLNLWAFDNVNDQVCLLITILVLKQRDFSTHAFSAQRLFKVSMMLKLKLQSFGHLMRRVDSLEKTLMLGGIEGRRRRG